MAFRAFGHNGSIVDVVRARVVQWVHDGTAFVSQTDVPLQLKGESAKAEPICGSSVVDDATGLNGAFILLRWVSDVTRDAETVFELHQILFKCGRTLKIVEFRALRNATCIIADGPSVCWSDARGCFSANAHSQSLVSWAQPFSSTRLIGVIRTGQPCDPHAVVVTDELSFACGPLSPNQTCNCETRIALPSIYAPIAVCCSSHDNSQNLQPFNIYMGTKHQQVLEIYGGAVIRTIPLTASPLHIHVFQSVAGEEALAMEMTNHTIALQRSRNDKQLTVLQGYSYASVGDFCHNGYDQVVLMKTPARPEQLKIVPIQHCSASEAENVHGASLGTLNAGAHTPLLATCRALEARVIGAQARLRLLSQRARDRQTLLERGRMLLGRVATTCSDQCCQRSEASTSGDTLVLMSGLLRVNLNEEETDSVAKRRRRSPHELEIDADGLSSSHPLVESAKLCTVSHAVWVEQDGRLYVQLEVRNRGHRVLENVTLCPLLMPSRACDPRIVPRGPSRTVSVAVLRPGESTVCQTSLAVPDMFHTSCVNLSIACAYAMPCGEVVLRPLFHDRITAEKLISCTSIRPMHATPVLIRVPFLLVPATPRNITHDLMLKDLPQWMNELLGIGGIIKSTGIGEYTYDCRHSQRPLLEGVRIQLQLRIGWASIEMSARNPTQLSILVQALGTHVSGKLRLMANPCSPVYTSAIKAFQTALSVEIRKATLAPANAPSQLEYVRSQRETDAAATACLLWSKSTLGI